MDDLTIVIPSHGRPGRVDTLKLVPDGVVCVEESQADAYRQAYPNARIEAHPDSVIGMGAKRQWMYERFGSIFMLDDDMLQMVNLSIQPGQGETSRVSPELIVPLIHRAAENCREAGAYLFGFNEFPNPLVFSPQQPFTLTGMIAGGATGLLAGSGLWFRTGYLQEDCWIVLLNAYTHRKAWIDLRYSFTTRPVGRNPGGLGTQRTMAAEKAALEMLQRTFGPSVVRPKSGKNIVMSGAEMDLRLPY